MAQVLRSYKEYIEKTRKSAFYDETYLQAILEEHGEILKAIRERDKEKAVEAVSRHLKKSQDRAETPKKMGAETAEANVNAGLAAARQIVAYFAEGCTKFQLNK